MNNRNLKDTDTPLVEIYDDILKFYFSKGYLDKAVDAVKYIFTGKSFKDKFTNYIMPFAKFIKRSIEYRKVFKPHFTEQNIGGKIWLFIASGNNRSTLNFLERDLEDAILVGNGVQVYETDKYQIPFHRAVLYFWKFPKIWFHFKNKYGKTATQYSDLIFKSIGIYEVAYATLSKYKPKCVVVANDHSEKQRALLNACKRLNIPIIYLQHASASELFPPLDFDLSLLEGQAALDIYQKVGTVNGKVQLIGMPKFDKFVSSKNYSNTVQNIGICTNILDKVPDIYQLIDELQKKFPTVKLSFRPHPAFSQKWDLLQGVNLSTKSEHIFDFLKKQDLLIAGNSSVHLEALLLNVTSIYYQVSPVQKIIYDPYGYLKNNLLEEATSISDLLDVIKKNMECRIINTEKVRYYNAVFETEHEGNSENLVCQSINEFLSTWTN